MRAPTSHAHRRVLAELLLVVTQQEEQTAQQASGQLPRWGLQVTPGTSSNCKHGSVAVWSCRNSMVVLQ